MVQLRVVVTEDGDVFAPLHAGSSAATQPDHPIVLIEHVTCGNQVARIVTTEQRDALLCGRCRLRLTIPNRIKTWGQLRDHFGHLNNQRQPIREGSVSN